MPIIENGQLIVPAHSYIFTSSSGSTTLSAAGEKAAIMFLAPETTTITSVLFRVASVTLAKSMHIGITNVTAGDPSGTWLGATGNGYAEMTPTQGVISATFSESVSITVGNMYAVVFQWKSDLDPGNLTFYFQASGGSTMLTTGHHFYSRYAAATWTKTAARPVLTLFNGTTPIKSPFLLPPTITDTYTINSSSSPISELGNMMKLTYSARVVGMYVTADLDAATAVRIYDSTGTTVLAEKDIDITHRPVTTTTYNSVYLDSPVEFSGNTWYLVSIRPTTVSNTNIYTVSFFPGSTGMAHWELGNNCYAAYRSGTGAWSYYTDKRVPMALIVDRVYVGNFNPFYGGYVL